LNQELNFFNTIWLICLTFIGNIAKVWGPDDGVPVLAVHGLMDNAGSFDTLAPLLPPHVRLVCLELCGNILF
jgi:hypothetical protein